MARSPRISLGLSSLRHLYNHPCHVAFRRAECGYVPKHHPSGVRRSAGCLHPAEQRSAQESIASRSRSFAVEKRSECVRESFGVPAPKIADHVTRQPDISSELCPMSLGDTSNMLVLPDPHRVSLEPLPPGEMVEDHHRGKEKRNAIDLLGESAASSSKEATDATPGPPWSSYFRSDPTPRA